MEYRGRNGIKFRQSSSQLATNALGKQAEVLILSDPGESNREEASRGSVDKALANELRDALGKIESSGILTDHNESEAGPPEVRTDSKTILDTLANEENSQNGDMVAQQLESLRPKPYQDAPHPVMSKRSFKKLKASLSKSFTILQLRAYHNSLLLQTPSKSTAPEKEFWGEKWDPVDAKSDNAGQLNQKSSIIDAIIKTLWQVQVKADDIEVGTVKGCISEFNFALLSSGGSFLVS